MYFVLACVMFAVFALGFVLEQQQIGKEINFTPNWWFKMDPIIPAWSIHRSFTDSD